MVQQATSSNNGSSSSSNQATLLSAHTEHGFYSTILYIPQRESFSRARAPPNL